MRGFALPENVPAGSLSLDFFSFIPFRIQDSSVLSAIRSAITHLAKSLLYTIRAFEYLVQGGDVIDMAYKKANGQPFYVETPDRMHMMVTSKLHLEEINKAPLNSLSLHAVAKDFLQPKHTMHGFEWKDVRGVEGTGFVRALRHTLTSRLPELLPSLRELVTVQISEELDRHRSSNGFFEPGVYALAKKVVSRANCSVFFGNELANDPEFFEAAHMFPYDATYAAEMLRLMPKPIGSIMARITTRNHRHARTLHTMLFREIELRLEAKKGASDEKLIPKDDGLQWLLETANKKSHWSVDRLVGEVMGIWYGSVHTLGIAITYALLDLYAHPECIEPLRHEVQSSDTSAFLGNRLELPLLDSFLRESARLSAFECTGVRRQALQTFTFSDGVRVNQGEWVCVPHRSMMRDPAKFTDATIFNPFRFCGNKTPAASGPQHSSGQFRGTLTDASEDWLVWGLGRILCPGRFYAAAILKLVVATMLLNYDCELTNPQRPRSLQWRSAIVPRNIKLRVRKRETEI